MSDSENAVLGSILLHPEVIENAMEILAPSDFHHSKNQRIFYTMQTMYERNEPIETLSVSQRLLDLYPDTPVSESDLETLRDMAPAPSSLDFYAQRVVKDHSRREAKKILQLAQKEIDESDDPMSKISEIVSNMENIGSNAMDQTIYSASDLYIERAKHIDDKQQGKIPRNILPTGLKDLDALLDGGLRFQHFDILAARPAVGKTSLAVQMMTNAALREEVNCLMFSIEMSKEEVMDKIMSLETKIPYRKISSGDLETGDWDEIIQLSHRVIHDPNVPDQAGIFIDDVTKDLNRMISIIRRCVRKYNVKFVVIDYLQLIQISGKFGTRDEQLGHAVNLLAYTAKTLNINILTLSQLNRGVESRESKRPMLSDLRESGNIEQAAWRVLSIYRDDYYKDRDSGEPEGIAEISVLKGKISNTGKIQCRFDKSCTRFENFS